MTIRTAAFAASLAAWCGWGMPAVFGQVDGLAIGTQAVVMPPGTQGAAGSPFALPQPNNPAYAAEDQYQGQVAVRSQHLRTAGDGRILFFEIDGKLYDGDGYLIADARTSGCTECLEPGVMEFVSVPVPGSCNLFYLLSAAARNIPAFDGTHIQWSLLDLDADNPRFPALPPATCSRKGKLVNLDGELGVGEYAQFDPWFSSGQLSLEPNVFGVVLSSNFMGALPNDGARSTTPRFRVVESANANGEHWIFTIVDDEVCVYRMAANGIYKVDPITGMGHVPIQTSASNSFVDFYFDADAIRTTLAGQADDVLALAFTHRGGLYPYPQTSNSANNLLVHYFNRNTGALLIGSSFATYVEQLPTGCTGVTVNLPGGGFMSPSVRGCAFSADGQGLFLTGERTTDCATLQPYVKHLNLQNTIYTELGYAFGGPIDPQWVRCRIHRNTAPGGTGSALYFPGNGQVGVLQSVENLAACTFSATALGTLAPPLLLGGDHPPTCGFVPRFLDIGIVHDRYLSVENRSTCCTTLQTRGSRLIYGHEQLPGMTPASWSATNNPYGDASPLTCLCDIVVKPGASLFPSNLTIKFADDAKLIVERGATVIATSSTFTSITCPSERWPGIRVEGTTNVPIQASPYQGRLTLVGSTVENAVVGAWTTRQLANGSVQGGYTGGRIVGSNSTFRNCITGVRIDPYQSTSTTGGSADNVCAFSFCNFITDAAWPDPGVNNPLYHAHLTLVKGIEFKQCKFRNDVPGQFPLLNRGWGIVGAAGFDVLGTTTADASLFHGLTVGVSAATGATRKANIRQSWFRDNFVGAYLLGSTAPEVSRSHFFVPDGLFPYAPIGVLLQQSTAYLVEENVFNGSGTGHSIGIHWKGDVLQENQIYNNTFTNLFVGTYVKDRHKGNTPTTESQGLQILCGDYTDCNYDYYVGDNTRIREDQGTYFSWDPQGSQLVGNRFFSGFIDGIVISGTQPTLPAPYFDYKRHNVPECDPINPSPYYSDINILTENTFNKAEACGNGYLPAIGGGGGVIGFELAAAQLLSAQANLDGTVDAGDRVDILDAIKQDSPWLPSHTLRDYLLARCPLSDEVLLHVIYRGQPMDDWHLTQVMLANAKLTEQVKKALETSELLNAYMLAIVLNAGSGPTVKDLLRQEVVLRAGEKARYFAIALDEWARDTITPDPDDSLRTMLAAHPDPSDYYLLAELEMAQGNYAAATDWLDALVVAKAPDPVLLRELLTMHQALGGDWYQADETQRAALATMAASHEPGAAMAWAILYQLGETDELPTAEEPLDDRSIQLARTRTTGVNDRPVLEAHPNPTTGKSWAVISVELDDAATLRVSDALGRVVSNVRLATGQRLVELDLAGLANGLYTCELVQGEYKLAVGKVTVQR